MAVIKPFYAVRPSSEYAKKVAALPYDVMNSDEAREMVKGNPYSFLHVDKAEIDLEQGIDPYDERVYQRARQNLNAMLQDGILRKETKPCFYIYELSENGRVQTGLVVCTSVDEYINGKIKKHELTREDKEQDRIRHVQACNANTGPIFLTYRRSAEISALIARLKEAGPPIYDFTTAQSTGQRVWIVDEEQTIQKLMSLFQSVEALYIADGHHRNASAVKVALKKREEKPDFTGEEAFNFYLSVLFASDELKIMDYNRLVKDLNGRSAEEFLACLLEAFHVTPFEGPGSFSPKKAHTFGCYLDKKWYVLELKQEFYTKDAIGSLDVSILQDYILVPLLDILDVRTSKRIDFVGGIRGLAVLEQRVDSGEMAAAFSMFPTSMEQLMHVADEDKIMPPKSTWFEPKLQSGLFIHSLED